MKDRERMGEGEKNPFDIIFKKSFKKPLQTRKI
jgi:hypothetical protein